MFLNMWKRRRKGAMTALAMIMSGVVLLSGIFFFIYSGNFLASALPVQASQTTLDKIKEQERQKQELQDRIQDAKSNITAWKGEEGNLQGTLYEFNLTLAELSVRLEQLNENITNKEEEIEQTRLELEDARATAEWQYESMKRRIQFMYEQGDTAYLELLFSSVGISDFLNRADYIEELYEYDRKMLKEYQETITLITAEEALLVEQMGELETLKAEVEVQQAEISVAAQKVSNQIAGYADQIAVAEQQALNFEAESAQRDADIAALKKQYQQELMMSQMAANSVKRDISQVVFAEVDLVLLANLIYCEAGGEPYEGQLAVGAVVINRVLSSVYPDTVTGVIYQNRQFSPVASGRLALALAENRATQSCYKAAQEAMSGASNVGGCVYFRTPIEGLTGIQIGGHIFY